MEFIEKHNINIGRLIPMYEFLDSGRDLIGKYFVIDYHQYAIKLFKIDHDILNDERWFQPEYILHHNLHVADIETNLNIDRNVLYYNVEKYQNLCYFHLRYACNV